MEMSEEGGGAAGGGGGGSSDVDLAQIEHQFSCLGTTDKDVLVNQLMKIIGPQLNSYAATFFLDMNNWNLQLAVGSYFDLVGGISESSTSDFLRVEENVSQVQNVQTIIGSTTTYNCHIVKEEELDVDKKLVIRLVNNGDKQWPEGSHLRCLNGLEFISWEVTNGHKIYIPPLKPNEEKRVRLENIVLPHPQPHPQVPEEKMCWQMITPEGYLFGSILTIDFEDINLTERIEMMVLDT